MEFLPRPPQRTHRLYPKRDKNHHQQRPRTLSIQTPPYYRNVARKRLLHPKSLGIIPNPHHRSSSNVAKYLIIQNPRVETLQIRQRQQDSSFIDLHKPRRSSSFSSVAGRTPVQNARAEALEKREGRNHDVRVPVGDARTGRSPRVVVGVLVGCAAAFAFAGIGC